MKQTIKSILRKTGRVLSRDLFAHYPEELLKSHTDSKVAQFVLKQHYKTLALSRDRALPSFKEVGFRQYSEFEEDGILLYLFSLITPETRTCLEIYAGDGTECNTANLIINHGWWGHLFDGDPNRVKVGTAFYASHKDTFLHPPSFECAWITAENINQLISKCGLRGRIDLLSLDMDGVDYWIWKAIDVADPTVVVCETQNVVPPDLALTVPYDPNFRISTFQDDFRGASLKAMTNLGCSKGYRLVGTHRFGFNAFFVKNAPQAGLRRFMRPIARAVEGATCGSKCAPSMPLGRHAIYKRKAHCTCCTMPPSTVACARHCELNAPRLPVCGFRCASNSSTAKIDSL